MSSDTNESGFRDLDRVWVMHVCWDKVVHEVKDVTLNRVLHADFLSTSITHPLLSTLFSLISSSSALYPLLSFDVALPSRYPSLYIFQLLSLFWILGFAFPVSVETGPQVYLDSFLTRPEIIAPA